MERTEIRKGGKVVVTINGYVMKPGAVLRDVDFEGADLRWVDLRGADLRGANLKGTQLQGANLSDARLAGTRLQRADLDGAILLGTQTFGSLGADFSRAHIHPFFSEDLPEKVGGIRLFMLPKDLEGPGEIRDMVLSRAGNLYWLQGERGRLVHLSRTGAAFAATAQVSEVLQTQGLALGLDAGNQLLLLGKTWVSFMDLEATEGSKELPEGVSAFRASRNRLPGADTLPLALTRSPWGTLLAFWPGHILDLDRGTGQTAITSLKPIPGLARPPILVDGPSGCVLTIDESSRQLMSRPLDREGALGPVTGIPLGEGPLPDLLAKAPGGRVWTARRGEHRLASYSLDAGKPDPVACGLPEGSRIHGIASGPDGNLWATDPPSDRIWRITPDGRGITPFDLPKGTGPAEILAYPGGRLLFTTLGGKVLGTLRAVGSLGKVWPELPPSLFQDPQILEQAESHLEDLRTEEAESEPEFIKTLETPEAPETPAPQPETERKEGPGPEAELERRGLLLTEPALRHIQRRHASPHGNASSRFNEGIDAEGLRSLIAKGLLEAQAWGLFGKVRMWDRRERNYTLCSANHVIGTCQGLHGELRPTRSFLVVTKEFPDRTTGRPVHGIVTAYPVPAPF
jgi:hypothetical protein